MSSSQQSPEEINVAYVAKLARLGLSSDETALFQSQLKQVISYVQQLDGLKVDGIEATAYASPRVNVFRQDEVQPSLKAEESVKNAPQKMNDLFRVPRVVE